MAQAGGPKKRKKTSAKNRPTAESLFVEKTFVQIVSAVKRYLADRDKAWRRKRPATIASGLKAAKLQLATRLTKQVDRLTSSGIPLTRREKVALTYVRENAVDCKNHGERIDIETWAVFKRADEGDGLRDLTMNVNLSWMMERIILARKVEG
jgi:hypothetical protein